MRRSERPGASLPDRAKDFVLAAFEGDDAIASALAGECGTASADSAGSLPATADMYLCGIRVRGFRGVGPETGFELRPGPGLTLVSGRNGSGKSSFAEAAEIALTGENRRWSGKPANAGWREGWRNLHAAGPVTISVDLAVAGAPQPTTVQLEWADGADPDTRQWTVQQRGARRETVDKSPWHRDFELYRPFLSYDELGAVFDGRRATYTTACTGCSVSAHSTRRWRGSGRHGSSGRAMPRPSRTTEPSCGTLLARSRIPARGKRRISSNGPIPISMRSLPLPCSSSRIDCSSGTVSAGCSVTVRTVAARPDTGAEALPPFP